MGKHGEELVLATVRLGQFLGLASEFHLEMLPIGRITQDLGESFELPSLVAERGGDRTPPESATVSPDLPELMGHLSQGLRLAKFLGGLAQSDVLGRGETREGLADHLRGVVAEHEGRPIVPAQDGALAVEEDDRIVLDALEKYLDTLRVDRT